jgi:hypothetical protein
MFTVVLLAVFAVWCAVEQTVSIDSVVTVRRESFYWVTILGTFALGTVLSGLLTGRFGAGYLRLSWGGPDCRCRHLRDSRAVLRSESACDDRILGFPCSHTIVGGIPRRPPESRRHDRRFRDWSDRSIDVDRQWRRLVWFATASKVDQMLPEIYGQRTPTPHGLGRFWA